MTVRWTDRALRAVADVYTYLANRDEQAARKSAGALLDAGNSLADLPRRGRELEDGRRVLVAGRYLIYYRVVGQEVRIVAVRHGARKRS